MGVMTGAKIAAGQVEAASVTAALGATPRWVPAAVAVALLAFFCILFRPGSLLWRRRFSLASRAQRISLVVFAALQCLVFVAVSLLINRPGQEEAVTYNANFGHWIDPLQYQRLGDAILHHRTWLDLPVDPTLPALDNPYDFDARSERHDTTGAVYYWDHAYFQGHYYSYFGVVPALILFAPYQAVTGRWLSTWAATVVLSVVAVCLLVALTGALVARLFPNASIALTWLVLLTVMTTNALWYYNYLPSFYGIPTLTSVALSAGGLLLWVFARRDKATRHWAWSGRATEAARRSEDWTRAARGARSGEPWWKRIGRKPDAKRGDSASALAAAASPTYLSGWRVICGAALLTANLGCRPQFALALLLAAPLFWHELVCTRQLFSVPGARLTCGTLLAALATAAPLGWYNAARFGSPLNTGATYNLTAYDITSWTFPSKARPSALFYQLFSPVRADWGFPFIQMTYPDVDYPHEPMMGGLFAVFPFLCLVFAAPLAHRALARRHALGYVWLSVVLAAVIVVVDIGFAGINTRYLGDYSLLVTLAAACVALALEDERAVTGVGGAGGAEAAAGTGDANAEKSGAGAALLPEPQAASRTLMLLAAFAVLLGLAIEIFGLFTTGRYESLRARSPELWTILENWFGPLLP